MKKYDLGYSSCSSISSKEKISSAHSGQSSSRVEIRELRDIKCIEDIEGIKNKLLKPDKLVKPDHKKVRTPTESDEDPIKKRILLIDDEKLVRDTLKRYFKKIGEHSDYQFDVLEAENALIAINLVHESIVNKTFFDVIIVDEYMPFMKGSFFIRVLKQIYSEGNYISRGIQIISHTAFDSPELKASLKESGADFVWNKPIAYQDFKSFFVV